MKLLKKKSKEEIRKQKLNNRINDVYYLLTSQTSIEFSDRETIAILTQVKEKLKNRLNQKKTMLESEIQVKTEKLEEINNLLKNI